MPDHADHLNLLLQKARSLPRVSGVYLMKDALGRVLYVGKAKCLPDRVSSYFIPSADLGPGRKQNLLHEVHDFDTIECDSEWEALLTENRLIKDIHPPYNARLTDDKTYPYLAITLRDDFPGVFITRQPTDERFRGAKILGPFTSTHSLRGSLQMLQRVFKFRTCELDIRESDNKRRYFRPCLLHAIGQCTAPCAARISQGAYREDIDRFTRFIESKRSIMIREMRNEMQQASALLDFEKAAVLRDQIRALDQLEQRGRKDMGWQPETESGLLRLDPRKGLEVLRQILGMDQPIRCLEAIDIAHLQGGETVGSKVCFVDGRPFKSEYRRYRIQSVNNDDYAAIREVVSRRYREAGTGQELYPDVILIDGGLGQLHAAQEAFASLDVQPAMVISLAKREEWLYVQAQAEPVKLPRRNVALRLCQAIRDEAHRFAQHYHHLLRKKKVMVQDSKPVRKKRKVDGVIDTPGAVQPPSITKQDVVETGDEEVGRELS